MIIETVGSRLKKVRKHFRYNQEDFLDITGYASKQVLSNMESGDRSLSVDKAQILQEKLGVNMTWLLLGKTPMFSDPDLADKVLRERGLLPPEIKSTPSVSPQQLVLLKSIEKLRDTMNKELDKLTEQIKNLK